MTLPAILLPLMIASSAPEARLGHDEPSPQPELISTHHRIDFAKFNSLRGFPFAVRVALSTESAPPPPVTQQRLDANQLFALRGFPFAVRVALSTESSTHMADDAETASLENNQSIPVTPERSEMDDLVEYWQPSMYLVLNGPVSIASETSAVMAGASGELLDGSELASGAEIHPSDAVWSGLVVLSGEGSVIVNTPDGMIDVEIGELTLIIVRDPVDDPLPFTSSCQACAVICDAPAYAICRYRQDGSCAVCFCAMESLQHGGFGAGGPGSTACSVSDAGGPE